MTRIYYRNDQGFVTYEDYIEDHGYEQYYPRTTALEFVHILLKDAATLTGRPVEAIDETDMYGWPDSRVKWYGLAGDTTGSIGIPTEGAKRRA